MSKPKSHTQKPFDDWQPYCSRYVAIFDIQSLIYYKGPGALSALEIFQNLLELPPAMENIEHMKGTNEGIAHLKKMSGDLKFFLCFDKVILVTRDSSSEAFTVMQMATLAFFMNAFSLGFPIRGAVALGEAIVDIDNYICVGQAFNDAAKLLALQDVCGVVFHNNTTVSTDETRPIREATDEDLPITTYIKLPQKDVQKSAWQDMQVLNWPIFFGAKSNALEKLNRIKKTLGLDSVSLYYNTVRFINGEL